MCVCMYVCMYVCVYLCMQVWMYVGIYAYIYIYNYVRVYMCTYSHKYEHVCVCAYVHTHTHHFSPCLKLTFLFPHGLYEVQSLSWGIMAGRCVKNNMLRINFAPYCKEATAFLKVQFLLCMHVRCWLLVSRPTIVPKYLSTWGTVLYNCT